MRRKLRLDAGGIPDHEKSHIGVTDQRNRCRRNDHAWSVVSAHGVERYGDWSTHSLSPIRKNIIHAAGGPRQPPETKPD